MFKFVLFSGYSVIGEGFGMYWKVMVGAPVLSEASFHWPRSEKYIVFRGFCSGILMTFVRNWPSSFWPNSHVVFLYFWCTLVSLPRNTSFSFCNLDYMSMCRIRWPTRLWSRRGVVSRREGGRLAACNVLIQRFGESRPFVTNWLEVFGDAEMFSRESSLRVRLIVSKWTRRKDEFVLHLKAPWVCLGIT